MLVEDDPPIGSGFEQGLKQEGFAVDCGMDGDAASLTLRSTGYGLLLLDLGLPNRDGLAVLASLRRRDDTLPAIDAGDGARVDVCARNDGTRPALEVAGDGPCIPEAERAHVWARFYRDEDTQTATSSGSGLGLSILTRIAEQHRATVAVSPYRYVFPPRREGLSTDFVGKLVDILRIASLSP
ncbi:response regulator [Burkholderia multivorans]|nr:response regulator [Burkholderia multivorans]MBN8165412.1 response regulator [Burkholderia multivorans]MBN8171202.1 response regulator [Burkholderia multivorans]MBN8176987.1 response regulator [Burkholderia multivorans]QSL28732.1 response regulator [Burkholderia multivorans]